ncbi:MAG: ferritin-like domain-containing protein [Proteobacteria bacterium]|nr:ferritin-like domain-containing protein [Pseudomonadota bacterium]
MGAWALEDISWEKFTPELVNPDVLKVVKAASLVEYNATDYEKYLNNIFHNDPLMKKAVKTWTIEEIQHGKALAQWATLADPTFDFEAALKVFREGFQLDLYADTSTRGSLSGELVARCVIETATSSFYTALKDMAQEPVLKEICAHIAADELRHYKLFYTHLQRYLETEHSSKLARLKVAIGRMLEAEDDELAMAYYAANEASSGPYKRSLNAAAYLKRVYGYYDKSHVRRGVSMILKASGFPPQGLLSHVFFGTIWMLVTFRKKATSLKR